MTCELPRQETDPTVTTHTPTQVTTSSRLLGAYLQFSGSFYLKIKSKKKQKYLGVEKEVPSLASIEC